jgi:aminopeptidase N
LRQVMIDPATITVFPGLKDSVLGQAHTLADALQDHPTRIRPDTTQTIDFPLLVIGLQDQIDNWLASRSLPKRPDMLKAKGSAVVWTAALPGGKSIVVVAAHDAEALAALVRPLPHYGRESYIVFEGAKVTESGVWPSRPQVWRF